jgi:hypothetical protein
MAPKKKPPKKRKLPPKKPVQSVREPKFGDCVTISGSQLVWTIAKVSPSGKEVTLYFPGTVMERFRVSVADLKYED